MRTTDKIEITSIFGPVPVFCPEKDCTGVLETDQLELNYDDEKLVECIKCKSKFDISIKEPGVIKLKIARHEEDK